MVLPGSVYFYSACEIVFIVLFVRLWASGGDFSCCFGDCLNRCTHVIVDYLWCCCCCLARWRCFYCDCQEEEVVCRLDLFIESYLAQLRPCGYSDLSVSILRDSSCFTVFSVLLGVSPSFGANTCQIWMLIL